MTIPEQISQHNATVLLLLMLDHAHISNDEVSKYAALMNDFNLKLAAQFELSSAQTEAIEFQDNLRLRRSVDKTAHSLTFLHNLSTQLYQHPEYKSSPLHDVIEGFRLKLIEAMRLDIAFNGSGLTMQEIEEIPWYELGEYL